jgi:DNA-binding NarL/FixJ family response regulator
MARESDEPRTVLVIDEDVTVLDATRAILEGAGYRVLTRDRSAGSISAIVKEKPEIVLVELNMVRLNGETIAKILNKTHPRPHVVVLFHSALPVETLRLKAMAAGAQGYVQKNADTAEFLRRIEHCVAGAKATSKSRMLASTSLDDDAPAAPPVPERPPSSNPRRAQPENVLVTRREAAPTVPRSSAVKTLFVDDDWSLLRAYRAAIGAELRAEFLTSGEEAVQRILSDSRPDIVVCDIVMPFVTGADLYSRAVAADPSWSERFLFLTGASSTRVVIEFMNEHEGRVLFKPVPSNRLLDAIRQLESRAAPRAQHFR